MGQGAGGPGVVRPARAVRPPAHRPAQGPGWRDLPHALRRAVEPPAGRVWRRRGQHPPHVPTRGLPRGLRPARRAKHVPLLAAGGEKLWPDAPEQVDAPAAGVPLAYAPCVGELVEVRHHREPTPEDDSVQPRDETALAAARPVVIAEHVARRLEAVGLTDRRGEPAQLLMPLVQVAAPGVRSPARSHRSDGGGLERQCVVEGLRDRQGG